MFVTQATYNQLKDELKELKRTHEHALLMSEPKSQAEVRKLQSQLEIVKAENKMLRSAFENLGFDVKDMKSILDKLVDGIVSGNKINVLKG